MYNILPPEVRLSQKLEGLRMITSVLNLDVHQMLEESLVTAVSRCQHNRCHPESWRYTSEAPLLIRSLKELKQARCWTRLQRASHLPKLLPSTLHQDLMGPSDLYAYSSTTFLSSGSQRGEQAGLRRPQGCVVDLEIHLLYYVQ